MTRDRTILIGLSRLEALHLAGLTTQFMDLLDATELASDDPAVARLVPDAYVDDAEASREFREVTEADLLTRRREDAAAVLTTLHPLLEAADDHREAPEDEGDDDPDDDPADLDPALLESVPVTIGADDVQSWLRTLAAIRLVLASRLGIEAEDDHDDRDPRFGVYDWIGYRLDGLVRAISED
ncbi:DUF2017 family protein [Microbacterium sp. BWT-B31]|uniref:DUF2017 family protein n=1 Tax=Microbacterium sp. BWT-B31 TaxID=3232072 RepID=UPI00352738DC